MDPIQLDLCQEKLGYRFVYPELLALALTHSSAKTIEGGCNERLEFLGDAVLGVIISEVLYRSFSKFSEGELTRVRSSVVRRRTLSEVATKLGLDAHIVVGKGIRAKKELPPSLAGDVFEAVVAAIYLDRGLDEARDFVLRNLSSEVSLFVDQRSDENYKSILQQQVQKDRGVVPTYEVISETGPDHHKSFQVAAVIDGRRVGVSWGRSKKDAEQEAARQAISRLKQDRAKPRKEEKRLGESLPDPIEIDEPEPMSEDDQP